MATLADDSRHGPLASGRRSPFQGEPTAGGPSTPYRFPKIEPLPDRADVSYSLDDVSQGNIIQVEEEPVGFLGTIRTSVSDSSNDVAERSSGEYDAKENKNRKKKPLRDTKSHFTNVRSRKRPSSALEKGKIDSVDSVSSELEFAPARKLHEPLRTRIVRILCWQLMLTTLLCLPSLLIADFEPEILTKLWNLSITIPVPFLNIITIPITTIFGVVIFFDLAFIAYLMLAQTEPPDTVALPFLPWDPKLVWKVNYVLYRWLRVAIRVGPKLLRYWAIRRMLKSKRRIADISAVNNIPYGPPKPGNHIDVYRAKPQAPTSELNSRGSASPSVSRPVLPGPAGSLAGELVLAARAASRERSALSPVIVFFHSPQLGPIKGKKWMYESLGRNLAKKGYTVVIPDLTSYPDGKAKQMVQDVRRVLNWTMINIRKYGGDPAQVHVMGHSLGAHLALLTLLQEAIVVSRDRTVNPDVQIANGLREMKIYDPDISIPLIRSLILLAPICDVNDQIIQEANRGVAHLSKHRRILGPSHTKAMFHSPVHILHAARNVINLNLLPPKILFIHGGLDEEVPHFQSELMKEMIRGVGLPTVHCRIYPVGHVDVVTALMMKQDEPCSSSILDDLDAFMAL